MILDFILLHINSTSDFLLALAMCIVPFVLGWLAAQAYYKVGWLRSRITDLETDNGKLKTEAAGLHEDLTSLRVKLTQADSDIHDKNMRISSLKNQLIILEDERNKLQEQLEGGKEAGKADREGRNAGAKKEAPEKSSLANALGSETEEKTARGAATVEPVMFSGVRYQQNDLKIVEGIGPKIDELLRAEGITTWRQLSETPPDRLNEILNAAGSNFNTSNPDTWPEQARLADEGNWEELKRYQDELNAGKVR
jgi:predicted flap endonuclease-1-like 5' DNA nuclease